MIISRFNLQALALTAGLVASAMALPSMGQTSSSKPDQVVTSSDVGSVAWVDQKVKDVQPSADERKFDQIGWVDNIVEAQRLAREHNRPIFLFAHDGRIATGRC